ncbi:MAG: hypothetical protein ABR574_09335 [Cryomorphaceae bacterium]|nr:hypothetical protein [Flavobacteriales bacterium]
MQKRAHAVILILFLLAGAGWSCSSQKQSGKSDPAISPNTSELAQRIKRDNFISSENIGRDSQSSPAYKNAKQLKDAASLGELRLLTDDDNAVLSAVAFEGLFERGYDQIDEVLVKYIERDESVQVISGDVLREISLLHYAFEKVMGYRVNDPSLKPEASKQISPNLEQIIRSKLYAGPPKQ